MLINSRALEKKEKYSVIKRKLHPYLINSMFHFLYHYFSHVRQQKSYLIKNRETLETRQLQLVLYISHAVQVCRYSNVCLNNGLQMTKCWGKKQQTLSSTMFNLRQNEQNKLWKCYCCQHRIIFLIPIIFRKKASRTVCVGSNVFVVF